MNEEKSVKKLAHTYGLENANKFLDAGWDFLNIDSGVGQFPKYNFAWTKDTNPVYPTEIVNPLKSVFDNLDAEIEKVKKSVEKK